MQKSENEEKTLIARFDSEQRLAEVSIEVNVPKFDSELAQEDVPQEAL